MSLALSLSVLEEDLGEGEVGRPTAHSNMVWAAQCMDTVYNCESHAQSFTIHSYGNSFHSGCVYHIYFYK